MRKLKFSERYVTAGQNYIYKQHKRSVSGSPGLTASNILSPMFMGLKSDLIEHVSVDLSSIPGQLIQLSFPQA